MAFLEKRGGLVPVYVFLFPDWGRGSGGVKSAGVSQSVRQTGRDESQSVPSPEKLSSKQGIWSSQYLRDLSQVARRTPRDTPVPLYTRTSSWPIQISYEKCSENFPDILGIAIHGPIPVQGETSEELSGPLVHTNFPRRRHGRGALQRAWKGAISGWTSPQSSGRKFLPEVCVKINQQSCVVFVSWFLVGHR